MAMRARRRDLHPPNMAEQAQRRAFEAQAQEKPTDNNHAFEELRHLIVAPEQEGIAAIQDRLENLEKRTEDVSVVVAEAIQMRREKGDDVALADALAPTIQETLRESVRRDPHVLADALFPVMGPAIRKSITETLRGMLESFNEALEHSLSSRGIQWRIEAFRTGRPFAEIVLMHSLLYRVEQVFLIHRETGLVLNHVVAPSAPAQDADMVAGLISAIQQFARDSFEPGKSESLGNMTFDELQIRVVTGPNAIIAAAIRGHAPETYNLAMNETLEEIQRLYSSALVNFDGDANPFRAAEAPLSRLLETQYREKKTADKKRPRAAIIAGAVAAVLLLGWIGYSTYLLIEWSKFLSAMRKQPGIVVVSYTKDGRTFHIQGFRDPLSEDPKKLISQAGLDPDNADLQLAPYYSLDDAIVARRAAAFLHPPAGVTLTAQNGELIAEGAAPQNWISQLDEKAPWIAGVSKVDESHLQNTNLQELKSLKGTLESVVLLFPLGRAELETDQESNLAQAEKNIRDLVAQAAPLHQAVIVELVGHTDITGVEAANLPLSRERADQIRAALLRNGVKSASLLPRGVGTSQPLHDEDTEEGRRLNRSVTFKVTLSPLPAAGAATVTSGAAPGN
jgi:outer membrane protein OmpA-like peptidoglycan-associated protein